MNQRRNLTPPVGIQNLGVLPTRRAGGARHNVSHRVVLFRDGGEVSGWALNISRGGLRAVIEAAVNVGEVFDVRIAEERSLRGIRVVWTQSEPDGTIFGAEFLERLEHAPAGVSHLDSSSDVGPLEPLEATEQS